MARHSNKLLCGVLALSAAFVLASCDTANALPDKYDEPIVYRTDEEKITLTDNQLGKIYDAIVSGKADYIHSELIYQIAVAQFGTYFDGIKDVDISTEGGKTAALQFISQHADVFIKDTDAALAEAKSVTVDEVRLARFATFKADIEKRLANKLYEEINSGNFNNKNGQFSELELALGHYFSGYDVTNIKWDANGAAEKTGVDAYVWKVKYITSEIDKDSLSETNGVGSVIKIDYLRDYLEKKVLRDIYSEKLIEEYVLNNKYSTLGRAYAREASYVKLAYDNSNKNFADKLLRLYADNVIYKDANVPALEKVADTWRGFKNLSFNGSELASITRGENYLCDDAGAKVDDAYEAFHDEFAPTRIIDKLVAYYADVSLDEAKILEALGITSADEEYVVLSYYYTKESKIGEILERYYKACCGVINSVKHYSSPSEDFKSELDKFTNNNARTRVKGVVEELSKLVLEDYTVDEWGLKNGGFSDLPSAVRDRLFNINVANAIDGKDFDPESTPNYIENSVATLGHYATSGKSSYVRYIYGHYYLNKSNAQRYEDDPYSFIFNEDNSYVVVNVKEAANSTKLNVEHANGYAKTKANPLFTENTAREIAKLLGTKESYKTDANQHYLSKCDLSFFDQETYDYFVSTYPDLYGE